MTPSTPFTTVLTVVAVSASIFTADILLQWALRRWLGKRVVAFEVISLFLFLAGGVAALRRLISGDLYFIAALGWYVVSVLNYFQVKGFFSRGYSVRILVDLLARGAPDSIPNMKNNYGGMGLRGLLLKRLRSLAAFGILRLTDAEVGPVTFLGKCVAIVSRAFRRTLRLDEVG